MWSKKPNCTVLCYCYRKLEDFISFYNFSIDSSSTLERIWNALLPKVNKVKYIVAVFNFSIQHFHFLRSTDIHEDPGWVLQGNPLFWYQFTTSIKPQYSVWFVRNRFILKQKKSKCQFIACSLILIFLKITRICTTFPPILIF